MRGPEKGSKTKKKEQISGRRYREHEESRANIYTPIQKENKGLYNMNQLNIPVA